MAPGSVASDGVAAAVAEATRANALADEQDGNFEGESESGSSDDDMFDDAPDDSGNAMFLDQASRGSLRPQEPDDSGNASFLDQALRGAPSPQESESESESGSESDSTASSIPNAPPAQAVPPTAATAQSFPAFQLSESPGKPRSTPLVTAVYPPVNSPRVSSPLSRSHVPPPAAVSSPTPESTTLATSKEGRLYNVHPFTDSGKGYGCLFPTGYKLEETSRPNVCPIRECRTAFEKDIQLGGHFSAAHSGSVLNDNLDGTFTVKYRYKRPSGTSPAQVHTADPLPPGAPPPAPTTYPPPPRNTKVPLPNIPSMPSPLSREASNASFKSGKVTANRQQSPIDYLNGHLSPDQARPRKDEIGWLKNLPRLRDLPDEWLTKHAGSTLDQTMYICALTFVTGVEITGPEACSGRPLSLTNFANNETYHRLSSKCIIPPEGARQILLAGTFLKGVPRCMACRYACYTSRQKTTGCKYQTTGYPGTPGAVAPVVQPLPEARGVPPTVPRPEPMEDVQGRAKRRRTSSRSSPASGSDSTTIDVESARMDIDQPVRAAPPPRPSPDQASQQMELQPMEDWEFAPGRVQGASRDTIAWSASYMSQNEPLAVAEDVGNHVLVLKPGGSHRFTVASSTLRILNIAGGKVKVKVGGQTFDIGRHGSVKIMPNQACVLENRHYGDAEVFCTAIEKYATR